MYMYALLLLGAWDVEYPVEQCSEYPAASLTCHSV